MIFHAFSVYNIRKSIFPCIDSREIMGTLTGTPIERVPVAYHRENESVPMLTDTAAKQAKPRWNLYKLGDSDGLSLWVQPKDKGGGKLWRFQYSFQGKVHRMSLGTYPEVSLREARVRRDACRKLVAQGTNPLEDKREKQQAATAEAQEEANTFQAVAVKWAEVKLPSTTEKYQLRMRRYLDNYIYPAIGDRSVATLTAQDFAAIAEPLKDKVETAHKVIELCGRVMRFAHKSGLIPYNPALGLSGRDGILPAKKTEHYAAIIKPDEIVGLLAAIDSYTGYATIRLYLQILPYVFCRPGELRLAEWSEFDFEKAMWDIPAARMKMRNAHLVPLSPQVIALLRELQAITGDDKYLFPGMRSRAKAMSEMTALNALRRMGYSTAEMTLHGFRAMARTVLAEVLNMQPDWIEAQLAHIPPGPLGRAYDRTTYLPQRKEMMDAWATFLDELKAAKD